MLYKVMYADCPWQYDNINTGGSMISGASQKYPTLSTEQLCHMRVPLIMEENSALFLWATNPMLPDALRVMQAWGYEYKTMLTWIKARTFSLGFWFRGQTEHLLFGVKGDIKPFRSSIRNYVIAQPLQHSEKPEKFRKIIEAINLHPRLELFARKNVPGWDAWGNECESINVDLICETTEKVLP